MRKVLALLLSVVMALSLMVTTAWADPVEQDLVGKTVILHTNDVHGEIARYAKVAALKAELKARGADQGQPRPDPGPDLPGCGGYVRCRPGSGG